MTELIPKDCPCCAGKSVVSAILNPMRWSLHRYVVKCDVCALSTFEFLTRGEAIEAWNRRARWANFDDDEMYRIRNDIWEGQWADKERMTIINEIEVELARREAVKA